MLPPPLGREGERVQPKWLYQFLLNPGVVRPPEKMKLRMPKFNMSDEDAMTLVNYFGAVAKQSNPGAGVTYPYLKIEQIDARYWEDRNKEYQERLKAVGGADGKGLDQRAKDLLGEMKKGVQLHLDAVKAAAATAMGDDKTRKEAEVKELTGHHREMGQADQGRQRRRPRERVAVAERLRGRRLSARGGQSEHLYQVSQHRRAENRERQRAGLEHRFRAFAAGMDVRVDRQSGSDVRLFADNAAEFPERFGRL